MPDLPADLTGPWGVDELLTTFEIDGVLCTMSLNQFIAARDAAVDDSPEGTRVTHYQGPAGDKWTFEDRSFVIRTFRC